MTNEKLHPLQELRNKIAAWIGTNMSPEEHVLSDWIKDIDVLLASDSELDHLKLAVSKLRIAIKPLVEIANAYENNGLDDARPEWLAEGEGTPVTCELYSGRGGKQLLTLGDCLWARQAVEFSEKKVL